MPVPETPDLRNPMKAAVSPLGSPTRVWDPIHPHKSPSIEIMEFPLGNGEWLYCTRGLRNPRLLNGAVVVAGRDFELGIVTRPRAPWIPGVLADLGQFCFDKRLDLGHGRLFQLGFALDKGKSNLKAALLLSDFLPCLETDRGETPLLRLVGLTEDERRLVQGVLASGDDVPDWVNNPGIQVVDFDRECTVNPEVVRVPPYEGAAARFRAWPRTPEPLRLLVQALRSLDRIIQGLGPGGDSKLESAYDAVARCLISLEWPIVDLETPDAAKALKEELNRRFDQEIAAWE